MFVVFKGREYRVKKKNGRLTLNLSKMGIIENVTQTLFEKLNQLGIKDYVDNNRPNASKKEHI